MKREILNIEVEFRTLLGGIKEPVMVRTLPDTARSNYYKILDIKSRHRKYYLDEYVTVIACTIAVHGKQRNALLVRFTKRSIWKLIM
ncbi:MAG: hypothetical protein KH031_11135 [Clostridiales bacterium]|nr:hypothetical protein [Clostridiales bacterium]